MPPYISPTEIRRPRSQAEVLGQTPTPAAPAGDPLSALFPEMFNPSPATQEAAQKALLNRIATPTGPAPTLAAQPKPGIVKRLLTNFFEGMAASSGVPQLEQEAQRIEISRRNADTQRMLAESLSTQRENMYELVDTPWGPMPRATAASLMGRQLTADAAGQRQDERQEFQAGESAKTREHQKELLGIRETGLRERAQQIRSRISQGVFIPLTNERGEVTAFYNNRNPSLIMPATVEGLRRAGLPAEEFATQAGMATVEGQMEQLGKLAAKRPDALGPAAGRWGKIKTEYLDGTITDPDVEAADLYQTADDIQNQLIYLRSGKQINEAEFKRLMATFPHANLPPSTFGVRLGNFKKVFKEILSRRQAGSPVDGRPAPSAPKGSGRRVIDLTQ